jgi:serine/threonine-protein kinase
MTLAAGARLGPYEIVAPLGAGGMGEVYRARDTRLEREVAVKVLTGAAAYHEPAQARFRQEALALSRLNHPNIETVYDFGAHEGKDYLVLEFVPGETLSARIKRGVVSEREAAELGAQIADALEEAHERGVLHRDLKPSNVVVTPKGRAKVLDFGLAKLLEAASDLTQTEGLTQMGSTAGTLAYMAPEQLLGEVLDARTDLYGLGVVLYEMVTGKRPFQASLATALTNEILHSTVVPPRKHRPELSERAESIVMRSLARDRTKRYQTASELAGELRRLAAGEPARGGAAGAAADGGADDAAGWGAKERRITSIAVLPLENMSGDAEQEYFADGMTEELIASLAQVRALRIISRTSIMRYKGHRKSLAEIAGELNVDAVVEGSVRRAGNRVRITAQLIHAATDRHVWAKSYERDLTEVLALQGEVARAIVEEIQVTVTAQEESRLKDARAVHPEAYEAYLKGRHMVERRTDDSLRLGLSLLEDAVRLDPTFVLAHVGVADAYSLMGFYAVRAPREVFPTAAIAARRALAIDPTSAEALTSLAYVKMYHEWDFPDAERMFRKAIDLNPKYPTAHLWLANIFSFSARPEEAEAEFRVARILDPMSMVTNTSQGWLPYWQGDFERSRKRLIETVAMVPEFMIAHYWLGLSCTMLNRHDEARASLGRAIGLGGRKPMTLAGLAIAAARAGQKDEARSLLAEIDGFAKDHYVSSYFRAQILASLGEIDEGMAALERAFEERVHWLVTVRNDPLLVALRQHPRFDDLAQRVGI